MRPKALLPFLAMLSLTTGCAITTGCGPMMRATSDFALTAAWDGYERVAVKVRNGRVEVRSDDVPEIRVSGTRQAGGRTLAAAEENLSQLTIHAAADPWSPGTFLVELRYPEHLRNMNIGASVLVELPRPCPARVETSNGAITARGLTGEVLLDSSNGAISVTGVNGSVQADTSNGRIEAEDITGDLTADTSNGRIAAEEISGDCTLTTSNGRIRFVAAAASEGRIELRTSNGSIHATLPERMAADLELSTSNGRVRVNLGGASLSAVDTSKARFRAEMNGGGTDVTAGTSNGTITVDCR